MTETSTEIATTAQFSAAQLRDLESFADAQRLLKETFGGEIVTSDVLGDGFTLTKEKDQFVGVPMIFVTWQFSEGDNGEFVTARVMAMLPGKKNPTKFIINDGSTGIRDQLKALADAKMLYAVKGLRKSMYKTHDESGKEISASTFYIDTTPA